MTTEINTDIHFNALKCSA